jgi:MHS family proline/betaine transporter-like MFS transporter
MNKKKSLYIAILGSALGLYNSNIYGFFALLLAPVYFPLNNPLTSRIAAVGAFAVGFLMRPIGGLIFGYMGDTYGRKKTFAVSILLTTLATFTIGALPSYEAIGIAAPLILVCCLAVQGSCIAGTYTGASLLIAEYSQYKAGFLCSLLPASSLIGIGIAAAGGAIVTLDSLPMWVWRVPFLLSLIAGILVLSLCHHVSETLVFKKINVSQQRDKYPLIRVLKDQGKNFLCAIGINVASTASFYILTMYIMGLSASADKSLLPHQSMFVNTGMMLLWIVSLPLMGYLSDKIGIKRLMQYGSMAIIVVAIPLFLSMHQDISVTKVAIVMYTLAILHASFVGPSGAFLAYLFPPQERYTGVGLGMALGTALSGAITPLIIYLLMQLTDNGIGAALYLMGCYFIGWLSVSKAHLPFISFENNDVNTSNKASTLVQLP